MIGGFALVSSVYFARGAGSFSVSIAPPYASIDLGESVEFTSTVTGDVSPSEYQWFLNGTAFGGATSASWTFTPSASGIYSVYLMVYISVTNSTGNETQSEAISRTARVMAGSQALTGILGYPHESSQAGGSGTQYTAGGSRFMLNVEANVTSMSCLMHYWPGTFYPDQNYSYSFAIYRDNNGAVGSLVAQTVQGTIFITEPRGVPLWFTLSFPSVVHLAPGAYWLMEVDNSTGQVSKNHEVLDTFESVGSFIEGMTFPASLPSPIYSLNSVRCIYASWDVSFSARLSEGKNVFAVASNSTISSLAYNSTTNELSFKASGPSGTTGYTDVFISKTILQEPSELTVTIDGKQTNFTSTSVYDFWALHFVYSHSAHNVAINLGSDAAPESPAQSPSPTDTSSTTPSPDQTPATSPTPTPSQEPPQTEITTIVGVAIVAVVIGVCLGLLIYLIKRK
jgi:hypothetical protein